eukprot:CAMPEP_0181507746 /NCGR_PEP_ID=MMETSP1110-20121109/59338_1 /TAXON_ID=174948 /ORGANISM="Symbiodinium sp., Strain CCMP421" /LENGTH=81 /DNA_ID=CAMNT_0023636983 /DNA_START=183 /DNA_END=428 /DNA_ORIENTATION=+
MAFLFGDLPLSISLPTAAERVSAMILASGLPVFMETSSKDTVGHGQELSQGVPSQMTLLHKLLHVLGGRAACSSLIHTTTG